ncbi:MAG: hypothetical protein A3F72_07700 [Bacteroidetes bacterium RIFCSPLOWO2_12_FULL_35_15]|nr:MAG: hypothetical protein A3F72_07700 [Bacteroidetes bacterium RIFCSPLOWO2_12_FULL_35_15]
MKNIKFVLLLLCFYQVSYLYSQGEYVVEIDKTNGAFIKTGLAITDITYIYPDDRTYDENTGTFIFASSLVNHSLFSINVSDGSIINNPTINSISLFEFDNTNSKLYGLEQDNATNSKHFVLINPATGTLIQLGDSIPGSAMYGGGLNTFDEINHSYIFIDPSNILYSINATNGIIIFDPYLSLASSESIANLAFDNSSGILYALLNDYNAQKFFLVTIDPATGINTRIGSGTTHGIGGGSAAIDKVNQHYSYLYSDTDEGGFAITTLDLATGNVVYNSLVQAFTANDNFYSLKYDNVQGKSYAIHWETNTVTQVPKSENSNPYSTIYPNPFKQNAILQFSNSKNENCDIKIYNTLGELILEIGNITTDRVKIEKGTIANGLYFFRIQSDKEIISKGNFIIE